MLALCLQMPVRPHAPDLSPALRWQPDTHIWVDAFCLRQCQNDFTPEEVVALVKHIGATFVNFDGPTSGSLYLTRSFCILETFAAVQSGDKMMTLLPRNGPLRNRGCPLLSTLPNYSVDSKNAQTRRQKDKELVDSFIANGVGFEVCNSYGPHL